MQTCLVFVKISQNDAVYDYFIINEKNCIKLSVHDLSKGKYSLKPKLKINADGILTHYFIQELIYSPFYRQNFSNYHLIGNGNLVCVEVQLVEAPKEIIDYNWNYRMELLVREKCELEHTLSWLSTLGGAFSALGDYFVNCAEMAGKISINQLKLAFRLNDPNIVSRCRLYLSLSLIQRCQFKLARKIIYHEFIKAKESAVVDNRLINMCKGVWCKLKYESSIYYKKI